PGVTGTNFNASVAGAAGSPHTITYTVVNGACTASATNSIVVNAIPNVSFTGTLPAQCENSTTLNLATVSNVSPSGGSFSGPGVTGTNFNASVAGAAGSPHTITYTVSNGICAASATNNIIVNALPTVTYTGNLPNLCTNSQPLDLTTVGLAVPAGGTFSGPGVSGITFNPSLVASSPNPYYIFYEYTDPLTGCYAYDSNSIIVNEPPIVTFTGNLTPQCENSTSYDISIDAIVSPSGGYFSGAGVNGNNFNASLVGVTGSPVTITYTYQDANGCINSATNTISIIPSPIVTINNTDTIKCIYHSPVTLIGTPSGGTFIGSGVNNNIFYPSFANIGSNTVIYSYTDISTGCTNYDTITFIIDECVETNLISDDNDEIIFYPNPNNGILYINTTNKLNNEYNLKVYNIYGNKIFETLINSDIQKINLHDLPTGAYFINVDGLNLKHNKLIINK
ncbi:MAG TPA: T9SS type A sorting domain-containing protein, partial [Bacteroidales bacterium]|nr:T9SS type A sorting domain-containing protein [Bacteroidales bacterium]